ncbi:hypothetical protein [Saccharothrix syringae]|uniref:Mce-associated membrane protein n=1 Tax=Saccharothrix syringae TaxID=103733 RepID=A0A5Q0HC07_SACSY|nr:hypothetical protein [Saccharothrix syringae]QFZ23494.1 hypothetical protein EKG83_44050 [Saccharothrix syringae]
MPPSRRRPVPTPPGVRPKVAGLRKRPAKPTDPEVDAPETGAAGVTEPAEVTEVVESPEVTEAASPRSPGELGLIEPAEDRPEDESGTPTPAPRGRRKRTGEAVPASVLDDPAANAADATDVRHGERGTAKRGRDGLVLPVALVVLAALLVGLGAWFQQQAGNVRYNRALVDSAGTTEVAGQTREAVEKAFSYNFADVAATEKAANELLIGKAQCQYNAIFGPVRTLAPEQKLVVTVKAVSSGVTSLDGDRATVLLFLDQVTTRTTDNQSGGGIAMMRASAQRVDGRWKVDNMEMFGQTGDQAAEVAKC